MRQHQVGLGEKQRYHVLKLAIRSDESHEQEIVRWLPGGSRLEVMSADEHTEADPANPGGSFAGSLPDFPDLSWEDFERASALARRDLLGALAGTPRRCDDEDYVLAAPGPDFGPGD